MMKEGIDERWMRTMLVGEDERELEEDGSGVEYKGLSRRRLRT